MLINIPRLTFELKTVGLPVLSVSCLPDGNLNFVSYTRNLTEVETAQALAIIAQHSAWDYRDDRYMDYMDAGLDTLTLIEALIEAVSENRPDALNAIQAKRLAIKAKHPKPSQAGGNSQHGI